MLIEPTVLDASINNYAVMLNRLGWLEPARLDDQRHVWTRLVVHYGGRERGVLTVDDVVDAICVLLAGRPPHEVMPSHIIEFAVRRALDRAAAAASMIGHRGSGALLYEDLRSYRDKVRAGELLVTADAWLDEQVERHRVTLINSGYAPIDIGPVISEMNRLAVDIKERAHAYGQQQPPPLDDDRRTAIADWFAENPFPRKDTDA